MASGERDALVRVAVRAGEACLALGRTDGARDAFERAIDLARGGEDEGFPPPAPELLRSLLGLRRVGRQEDAVVLGAVSLVREALLDSEAWWDLPDLAEAIGTLDVAAPAAAAFAADLELALRACEQRVR